MWICRCEYHILSTFLVKWIRNFSTSSAAALREDVDGPLITKSVLKNYQIVIVIISENKFILCLWLANKIFFLRLEQVWLDWHYHSQSYFLHSLGAWMLLFSWEHLSDLSLLVLNGAIWLGIDKHWVLSNLKHGIRIWWESNKIRIRYNNYRILRDGSKE